jgi:hypothetical protein
MNKWLNRALDIKYYDTKDETTWIYYYQPQPLAACQNPLGWQSLKKFGRRGNLTVKNCFRQNRMRC